VFKHQSKKLWQRNFVSIREQCKFTLTIARFYITTTSLSVCACVCAREMEKEERVGIACVCVCVSVCFKNRALATM